MSPMNNRRMTPMAEPGVLDFAPGAAAAYSLRNLSLSYVGPVVTVRRSTDSAEADFTASEVSDGTLAGWAGADGFVKQWWDQSGNARHATASGTAQPQIVDSGVLVTEGGKAALQFDGVDDRMSSSLTDLTTPFSAVAVFVFDSLSGNSTVFGDWNSSALDWYLQYNLSLDGIALSEDVHSVLPSVVSSVSVGEQVAIFFMDGAPNILQSKDGALAVSNAAADGVALTGGNGLDIGALGTSLQFFNGRLQELIIYPTDQTALRTRIEGNLAWYY